VAVLWSARLPLGREHESRDAQDERQTGPEHGQRDDGKDAQHKPASRRLVDGVGVGLGGRDEAQQQPAASRDATTLTISQPPTSAVVRHVEYVTEQQRDEDQYRSGGRKRCAREPA
jgi:hypothetical protein